MNKALLGAPLGLIMVVAMVLGSGAADEQQPTVGTPAACGNGPGVPSELVPAILAAAKHPRSRRPSSLPSSTQSPNGTLEQSRPRVRRGLLSSCPPRGKP